MQNHVGLNLNCTSSHAYVKDSQKFTASGARSVSVNLIFDLDGFWFCLDAVVFVV